MKRTDFEVCKSVFEVLFQNNPIHKSDLRGLTSLGPRSISKWVDLIAFIQSQPKLKITKKGRYQMLELEKPPLDEKVDAETIEALKIMKSLIELPSEELKRRLDEISSDRSTHKKKGDQGAGDDKRYAGTHMGKRSGGRLACMGWRSWPLSS